MHEPQRVQEGEADIGAYEVDDRPLHLIERAQEGCLVEGNCEENTEAVPMGPTLLLKGPRRTWIYACSRQYALGMVRCLTFVNDANR